MLHPTIRFTRVGNAKRKVIDLRELAKGAPALTPALGEVLCEAATMCLEQVHQSPVPMKVQGSKKAVFVLSWPAGTAQVRRSYNDLQDATRDGATGIAILLVKKTAGYTVVLRSRKGTGFDYWLGNAGDALFQNKARLEVSGILAGGPANIAARKKKKDVQTKRSDKLGLPAHIVVVEFAGPVAHHTVRR